jgi:hypothetical protein
VIQLGISDWASRMNLELARPSANIQDAGPAPIQIGFGTKYGYLGTLHAFAYLHSLTSPTALQYSLQRIASIPRLKQ